MSDIINNQPSTLRNKAVIDDEIDLRELFAVIWAGKWLIIIITLLFSVAALIYAIGKPDIYKSEALLTPTEQQSSLNGLQSQLGGLASLAGINLGGGAGSKTTLAIEILKSRQFSFDFIAKRNILADLIAWKEWNMETNTIIYDPDIYSVATDLWVEDSSGDSTGKPSLQEAQEAFSDIFSISVESDTGMVKFAIEHVSPLIAQQWVTWLIEDINLTMKTRAIKEAQASIKFLDEQINQTKISDIRAMLFSLVEEQTKTIMFANVRDEYVFRTIDPALVPEQKSSPKRALICIIGVLGGGFIGVFFVIVRHFSKNNV